MDTGVLSRRAYTYEPIHNLTFYSMYATSYDPAAADIFSVNASTSLQLTSARIYETGVKQLLWDDKAEWTVAAYDIYSATSTCRSPIRPSTLPGRSPPRVLK